MVPAKMAKLTEEVRLSRLLFGDGDDMLENCKSDSEDRESNRKRQSRKPKAAAWHDEDDDETDVAAALSNQGRKMPDAGISTHSEKYTTYLRKKHETIMGSTPDWARLDKKVETDSDDEITQRTGHVLKSKSRELKKGFLEFKNLQYLNNATWKKEKMIRVVEFHPTSSVSLTGGNSGILSLNTVDGKNNDKIHTVLFKKFPIWCGRLTPDGDRAFLGSNVSHYFTYDLMNAKALRFPLPNRITRMDIFEISPCGKFLAIVGKFGNVHLLCAKSRDSIHTLKQNENVTALCFNTDGSKLFAHSETGNVTVWDISTMRVCHKWLDEGCICGTAITISPSGEYFVTGSKQGIVNLYETKDVLKLSEPKPKKTFTNLTMGISGVKFNQFSEILAFYSSHYSNAVRLVHVPSLETYMNFPNSSTNLGNCSTLAFSPHSGYFSMGTNKKLAYLFRLKHYKNY